MKDESKIKDQLTAELAELRRRIAESEAAEAERQQAKEALRMSEEKHRNLFEHANDSIFIIDPSTHHFLDINENAAQRLGYTREELLELTFEDIDAPTAAGRNEAIVHELLETGSIIFEHAHLRKDGTEMPIEISSRVIEYGGRQVFQSFVRDITERVQAEEELKKHHDHLEELVQARTAELQLEITQRKQAEEAQHLSLYETTRGQRTLLALSQAAQAVQRARTPEDVYRTVGSELAGLGYHATILTLTEDNSRLGVAYVNFLPALLQSAETLTEFSLQEISFSLTADSFFQSIIDKGEPVFAEQVPEHFAEALHQSMQPLAGQLTALLGTDRSIIAPLMIGEEAIGLLAVGSTSLTEADMPAIAAFANQAAIAIENARLYQQVQWDLAEHERTEEVMQRRNRELALINRVGQTLTSTLDPDEVLDTLLRETRNLLDVVGCSIWLRDPHTDELVCQQTIGPQEQITRGWRLAPGEGIAGWVAQSGESLIVPDVRMDDRHFSALDQQTGLPLRSILSVPLLVKEERIGVLQVVDTVIDRFGASDLELAELIAASAAIAIENAQLYAQAREDAETKSVLLQEVNHRTRNNLSAIIGLLYTERRRIAARDRPIYESITQSLVKQVRAMAVVHNLLASSDWAPLQLSEMASQVVRSSLGALPRHKSVFIEAAPSPVRATSAQARDLAIVITELVTNTVKHVLGERDATRISIHISLEDHVVVFQFRDDGPGYPEPVLQSEQYKVGLDLIHGMVHETLRGELSLRNDNGAVTTIRFPANAYVDSRQSGGE